MGFSPRLALCPVLLAAAFAFHGAAMAAGTSDSFESVRARCPGLANVDLAALAAMPFDVAAARTALGASATPQLGDAAIVMRLFAPSGFGRAPSYTTHVVARRVKGRWHYTRVRRPLVQDATPGEPVRAGAQMQDGLLSVAASQALDAALDDPCFAHEPDYAPRTLPLLGNIGETCVDGSAFLLQIERAEGVRTIRQDCVPRWHAGEIMRLLRDAIRQQ